MEKEHDLTRQFAGLSVDEAIAYHVTNVSVSDSEKQPNWEELACSVADDGKYDGHLIGLPLVFLSTTTYKGGKPTQSVYPRNGIKDKKYWRVSVKLNQFATHSMWLMAQVDKQVHILLTPQESSWTIFLSRHCSYPSSKIAQLPDNNVYLKRANGKFYPNNSSTGFFVNIALIMNALPLVDAEWDHVVRIFAKTGPILPFPSTTKSRRLLTWLFEKIGTSISLMIYELFA